MGACGLIEAQSSVVTATEIESLQVFTPSQPPKYTFQVLSPLLTTLGLYIFPGQQPAPVHSLGFMSGVRSSGRNDMRPKVEATIVLHADNFQGVTVSEIPDADASHPHVATPWQAWRRAPAPRIQARGGVILSRLSLPSIYLGTVIY